MNYDADKAKGDALGKTNIISPTVTVVGDLRFLTEEQKKQPEKKMKAIVANNLNGKRQQLVCMIYLEWLQKKVIIAYLLTINTISRHGIGKTVAGDQF
jgi:glutamate carboxypeptidase